MATDDRDKICDCGEGTMHTRGYCAALRAAQLASVMGSPEPDICASCNAPWEGEKTKHTDFCSNARYGWSWIKTRKDPS